MELYEVAYNRKLPDFLRALSLPATYLRSPYFRIIYHIRSPYWEGDMDRPTDPANERLAGWPDLATEPGWRNETGNRGGKEKRRDGERGREPCGEKSLDFEN